MNAEQDKPAPPAGGDEFSRNVGRQEDRKLKARTRRERTVWFGLGMMGLIGWGVAVPTLACVALGYWLDQEFPTRFSWRLILLFAGVVLGCLNAWFWVKRESRHD